MDQILAYRRENGDIGVRNYLAVIPSVMCANHVAKQVAAQLKDAFAFPHPTGCGQHGKDLQQSYDTLAGIGQNGNFGAVIVVGLGCERIHANELAARIAETGKPVEFFNIQEVGGTLKAIEHGVRIGRVLSEKLFMQQREPVDVSLLKLGLKCGGTDATSGIVSNPALGLATDRIISQGGTAYLSEVNELLGTENIMRRRAATPEVYAKMEEMLQRAEKVLNNLTAGLERTSEGAALVSPGNFDGGVSSVSEKALGGIHKSGSSKFTGVLEYAERPKKDDRGLFLMYAASNDCDVVSSEVAGGAHIVSFVTGVGTPTGFPGVPVLKITGNSRTYHKMEDDIDINAGAVIDGEVSFEEMGDKIYREILDIASGKPTKAELLGHDELFAIGRFERF